MRDPFSHARREFGLKQLIAIEVVEEEGKGKGEGEGEGKGKGKEEARQEPPGVRRRKEMGSGDLRSL